MRKKACCFFLSFLLVALQGIQALACDVSQVNNYVPQILFGDRALSKVSNDNLVMLLNALYLCSMQADGQGEKEIDYLKKKSVSGLPSLSSLDINENSLLECSHNSWESVYINTEKQQQNRKKVLENTVKDVFGYGFWDNWTGDIKDQYESFAALLYYSHILADYLADEPEETDTNIKGKEVPSYSGESAYILSGGRPSFTNKQKSSTEDFITFSDLDSLGRAGVAFANVGPDTIASVGERQGMAGIRPSGWNQNKYEGIVNSQPPYLYNRCHLLAHQLGGIEKEINLITGTRYLNEAMIPHENKVVDYIRSTGNHVLYRATPVFEGDNKLASGIQIEAYSVEDSGKGICFNVYCYNVQPGVGINYANGENERSDEIYGEEGTLPFIVKNPSEDNPDLVYEMGKHLQVLFDTPENKHTYDAMTNEINSVAAEARAIKDTDNSGKYYISLKKFEYEYFSILKSYVPALLEDKDFFKEVFK